MTLVSQQDLFDPGPTGKPSQSVAGDDPVARDQDRDGILPEGVSYRPAGPWPADPAGKYAVADQSAEPDSACRLKDIAFERRETCEVEPAAEPGPSSSEVLPQLRQDGDHAGSSPDRRQREASFEIPQEGSRTPGPKGDPADSPRGQSHVDRTERGDNPSES
jgi:hypothetical protein